MANLILEYHNQRKMKPDDVNELIHIFLFSLLSEEDRIQGRKPTHDDCFWTEVRLERFLAEQPGWASLSKDDKIKVMYHHACEEIRAVGRKLRQVRLHWKSAGKLNKGPLKSPSEIQFDSKPMVVETENLDASSRFQARSGAGL